VILSFRKRERECTVNVILQSFQTFSGLKRGEVSRSRFKNERITVLFDLKSESCETFEHQEDEKKGVEEDSFYWDEKLYSGENPVLGTKNLG
jgi:hypothetical protein